MIELQRVSVRLGETELLRGLDFSLKAGEAVALLGPNGAGKTTLLRLLNGLVFPTSGRYLFDGTPITAAKMREHRFSKAFHQRMGFVFQDPAVMLFSATVREELAFGPEQMGLAAAEVARRTEDALRLFRLEKLAERTPYTLSGGEKKRVALAAVFTMNPAIWTLDEPLAALDEETARLVTDFLASLKAAGKTLIFSTHERELADRLADVRLVFSAAHEVRVERA